MAYPNSIDNFSTKIDGVDYPKASHINSLQTAVEALETKVGITNSTDSDSLDYQVNNLEIWPIGSVFLSVVSTNPATLLGFGTWSQIAQGQMLIGQKGSDSDFNTAEETGGSKTVTIAKTNLPNVSTSAGTAHTHTQNSHKHTIAFDNTGDKGNAGTTTLRDYVGGTTTTSSTTATNKNESAHTHPLGGSGTALSVMNPYFVIYAFKRTA